MPLQNLILGRYGFGPGDIYYQVPPSPLHRLKPDFRASMFYNGYRWEHRTNALGIRDDDFFTRADLVLLGDSMVYGHGLDFRDTLSENLERRSGLRAANLGVQGDYPPFELARLEETGLALKPKAVLFFTELDQDMEDMILRRPSDKDVQALLSAPVLENPQARRLEPPPALAWRSWPSVKVFRFMARRALRGLKQESSGPQPSADLDMDGRAFEVFFRVIEKARDLCRERGIAFAVVFHPQTVRERGLKEKLAAALKEKGIATFDLGPAFAASPLRGALFLPGDGHYSAQGAALAAQAVYGELRKNGFISENSGGNIAV